MNSNLNILTNNVKIIIMDNDSAHSAEKTVKDFKVEIEKPVQIEYHCYPKKGLSNVRNELLRRSFETNSDYIVFIDDDEFVSVNWLIELLLTINSNEGDMAMGPVIPVFEENVSEYIECWYKKPYYNNNANLGKIATNNLIIRVKSLISHQIWFDKRFNETGAEDTYFGLQMLKKGSKAYFSSNAIVYETIPKNRANLSWLMKRFFNGANTYTYILKIENEYFLLFIKIIISLIYIISGFIGLLLVLFPIRRKYFGLLKLSEGFGSIAAILNINYNEYK